MAMTEDKFCFLDTNILKSFGDSILNYGYLLFRFRFGVVERGKRNPLFSP